MYKVSQARSRSGAVPILLLALLSMVITGYAIASSHDLAGDLVMPLDDTYIHFQYARQLATGNPFQYNDEDPRSSGATSFLYPIVLAPGYVIGFRGMSLAYWALAIGTTSLFCAATISYRFALHFKVPTWIALLTALCFLLNGASAWHAVSGMETMVVTALALCVVYTFTIKNLHLFVLSAMLLALARPEASAMSAAATIIFGLQNRSQGRRLIWLMLPLAAVFVQPGLNYALTDSLSASGSQAKSILNTVPFDPESVISRILNNYSRMWRELVSDTRGLYLALPVLILALDGALSLMTRRINRATLLVVLLWLTGTTLAISTLDTAFWHFKRYQIPLIALFYPFAAIGAHQLLLSTERLLKHRHIPLSRTYATAFTALLLVTCLMFSLSSLLEFSRLYKVNIQNITVQPLAMARWLQSNTAVDARVAVHDVGMMRYIGERYTVDMVGLTTSGAADSWRNGPGSVAEFLLSQSPQIDYVAAYTTARGLNYLADTRIYGEQLAGFTAAYDPADNVALGAEFQGIFRYEIDQADLEFRQNYAEPRLPDLPVLDTLNVAELESETVHDYVWSNIRHNSGFSTEVYDMRYPYSNCMDECQVIDGGRLINGSESFRMEAVPHQDAVLITRIHPFSSGSLTISVNGAQIATRIIPHIPGQWLDLTTPIPAAVITSDEISLEITPTVNDGFYMPYYHWLLGMPEGIAPPETTPDNAILHFQQPGSIDLIRYALRPDPEQSVLSLDLVWHSDGMAKGDYKFFVHVYDGTDEAPVAQWDGYLGEVLPPGNWLSGTRNDTIEVDLSELKSGDYQIAIGFYEATSFSRLTPQTNTSDLLVDEAGQRAFIGQIEIPDEP